MKSGTSYLQHLCQTNRQRLKDAGLLWPGMAPSFAATHELLGIAKPGAERQGAWRRLVRRVEEFDGDVLISNELLLAHRPALFQKLVDALDPAEVHAVITARDLARVIPSQWQTLVRSGSTVAWSDYVESVLRGPDDVDELSRRFWRQQDLRRAVRVWGGVLEPGRVTLVTVPGAGADPAAFSGRFLSALGVDVGDLEQPSYRNVSLGVHSAELVRRLNADLADWDWNSRRMSVMVALNSRVLEARAGDEPRLSLNASQRAAATDLAASMVQSLRRSNVRVVGELNDLLPGSSPLEAAPDPAESSADELLAAANAGLIGLAKEYADLAVGHKAQRMAQRDARAARLERSDTRVGGVLRRAVSHLPGVRTLSGWVR
jgi:hypothetical protein